jgi:CelD/BcsL family acetyltransferase involved in cellulose biosynthesis
MYSTEIIKELKRLQNLEMEWRDLLNESLTNTIFLTWEWITSWWNVFKNQSKLFVIAIRDNDGRLVGIAPLMIRKRQFYGFPVQELTFIGIGLADRQDFIISQKHPDVFDVILQIISESSKEWDIAYLDQIPSDSLLMRDNILSEISYSIEESSICPFIRIQGDWDSYLKSLSFKMRKDLRNKMNKMGKEGSWEFKVDTETEDIFSEINEIQMIEKKSRRYGTEKDFFSIEKNLIFMQTFLKICSVNQWYDLAKISFNGKTIAVLLGFLYNHEYIAYIMTFNEEFYRISPGKILLNEKIKWCFEHGESIRDFDFSRGESYIKDRWASESKQHYNIVFFRKAIYPQIIKFIVFGLRPKVKKLVKK